MTARRNLGQRPETGSAQLRVRFRNGQISKSTHTAAQWARWTLIGDPFDITHYKIED